MNSVSPGIDRILNSDRWGEAERLIETEAALVQDFLIDFDFAVRESKSPRRINATEPDEKKPLERKKRGTGGGRNEGKSITSNETGKHVDHFPGNNDERNGKRIRAKKKGGLKSEASVSFVGEAREGVKNVIPEESKRKGRPMVPAPKGRKGKESSGGVAQTQGKGKQPPEGVTAKRKEHPGDVEVKQPKRKQGAGKPKGKHPLKNPEPKQAEGSIDTDDLKESSKEESRVVLRGMKRSLKRGQREIASNVKRLRNSSDERFWQVEPLKEKNWQTPPKDRFTASTPKRGTTQRETLDRQKENVPVTPLTHQPKRRGKRQPKRSMDPLPKGCANSDSSTNNKPTIEETKALVKVEQRGTNEWGKTFVKKEVTDDEPRWLNNEKVTVKEEPDETKVKEEPCEEPMDTGNERVNERIVRRDRKVARAIEKFSRQVMKIVTRMGYFPGTDRPLGVSSVDTDDSTDFFTSDDDSEYYSYTCSCSCSSYCACSSCSPGYNSSTDFTDSFTD